MRTTSKKKKYKKSKYDRLETIILAQVVINLITEIIELLQKLLE